MIQHRMQWLYFESTSLISNCVDPASRNDGGTTIERHEGIRGMAEHDVIRIHVRAYHLIGR